MSSGNNGGTSVNLSSKNNQIRIQLKGMFFIPFFNYVYFIMFSLNIFFGFEHREYEGSEVEYLKSSYDKLLFICIFSFLSNR